MGEMLPDPLGVGVSLDAAPGIQDRQAIHPRHDAPVVLEEMADMLGPVRATHLLEPVITDIQEQVVDRRELKGDVVARHPRLGRQSVLLAGEFIGAHPLQKKYQDAPEQAQGQQQHEPLGTLPGGQGHQRTRWAIRRGQGGRSQGHGGTREINSP